MCGHTYLHKNRFGVYYLRMVIPKGARNALATKRREVRCSLRTKDRGEAKRRLLAIVTTMTKHFDLFGDDWEQDPEARFEVYKRGLALIRQHGRRDLDDEFDLEELLGALGSDDLKAYIFAREHQIRADGRRQLVRQGQMKTASWPKPVSAPTPVAPAPLLPTTLSRSQLPDVTVTTAIERFAQSKLATVNDATTKTYVSQCKLFLKIVAAGDPDLAISAVTPMHLHQYVDVLHRLPKKLDPADPRPLTEILASATSRPSETTKSSHARAVSMFLKWCEDQQYRIHPNLERILAPLRKKPKSRNIRKHFEEHELLMIFESQDYQSGLIERDADYWIPILALYTGARQAELCQLTATDIYRVAESDIWVIDINDSGPGKRLKTLSSKRQIPVHPKLHGLGFLEFALAAAGHEHQRLFPDEKRNGEGEFGAFSKRFNRYLARVGIIAGPDQQLNFHSLRHTLQNDLIGQGYEEYVINQIVGHSPARSSQSVRTYSKGAGLDARLDILEKFDPKITVYPCKPTGMA